MNLIRSKKGVAWKYIVGGILALLALGILLWIISKSGSNVKSLFQEIINIF